MSECVRACVRACVNVCVSVCAPVYVCMTTDVFDFTLFTPAHYLLQDQ